jgi:hypothetical protein
VQQDAKMQLRDDIMLGTLSHDFTAVQIFSQHHQHFYKNDN